MTFCALYSDGKPLWIDSSICTWSSQSYVSLEKECQGYEVSARVRPSKFNHQPAVALSVQKTSVRGRASTWTTRRIFGRHKRRFCVGRHQIDSLRSFFYNSENLRRSAYRRDMYTQQSAVCLTVVSIVEKCPPFNICEISTNASCNIEKLACESPIVYLLLHFCLNRLR